MTDMNELVKRKQPLNLAIVYVEPENFIESYLPWLEITAFISAQRMGEATVPADGLTPALTAEQIASGAVHKIANDTIIPFAMTAAMKGDKAAVDMVEAALKDRFGNDYPGNFGLWHFRGEIAAPQTLEDHIGQAGKKMLEGDIAPPPKRPGETWETGLRFLEYAQGSNFKNEIIYPLAVWQRERWEEAAEKGVSFMSHIEDNLPLLRGGLEEQRNDAAFIANMLLLGAPAFEIELSDEVSGLLRSLARR